MIEKVEVRSLPVKKKKRSMAEERTFLVNQVDTEESKGR